MCRRAAVIAAVIGSLVWSAPLLGQESEAELLQRIERLRSEVAAAARAAEAAATRRESEAVAARRPLVTALDVGPLRVMTLHEQAEVAAELFETVWREDFHGIDGSPSLERSVFVFDWWLRQPSGIQLVAAVDMADLVVRRVEVARRWAPRRGAMREHVRNAIWYALQDDFPEDSPVRAWSAGAPYLPPEDAYRSLAMVSAGASRSCLGGDTPACAVTLGLVPLEPSRLAEWFSPEHRESLVARAVMPPNAPIDRRDRDVRACLIDGDTASCDAVLARMDGWRPVLPAARALPVSALWYAVGVGGEGAWRSAIEDPTATPVEVLERASGLDSDAVVAGWRALLMEHRPSATALMGRSAAAAVFWILVFAGLAMRSTRWRFA